MTTSALTSPVNALADAVRADWRWVQDDLSVNVLGMLLYGLTAATAESFGLGEAAIDAAMLQCMTEHIGAAAKWSGGLVAEANASARDTDHHPVHYELIGVGRTYHGVTDQRATVDNVFATLADVRGRAGFPEPAVAVFLNPLAMLLAGRERQKGSPLTEAEVLAVRDTAACMRMPLSQAEQFYSALDARVAVPRLNPERIWEEWQAVRDRVTWSERE